MLTRILKFAAVAVLALAFTPALAAEDGCTAALLSDGEWPALEICAEPIALESHFTGAELEEMVAVHVTTDETPAGHEETAHRHVLAMVVDEIEENLEP